MAKSRLLHSTMIVSAMTMLSRILGLVRDVVLMGVFGAGGAMDAFLVAFKIPNFLRRLFAEGAFSQAFVPVLSEYKATRDLASVKILISRVSGALMLILSTLSVAVITFAPWVMALFAPGFDAAHSQLATTLLRLTFPYLLFISMTAFLGSILQSYGRFATPAAAPVLLNATLIAFALLVAPHLSVPIMALGYGVALAGLLQMMIQLPEIYQEKLLIAPKIDFHHQGVQRILALMLPAIFGVSVTQINLLLNTVFASLMMQGSVSWIYTAERLSELPLGLIGVAIGTVILPNLSQSCASGNKNAFAKTLDWALKLVILVGLPASVAMFLLSDVLMMTLFVRGAFGENDALMSAFALKSLAGGILGFMLIKIFAPAFFARQDSKTPVRIGIISVFSNMVFSLLVVGLFYVLGLPLHGGLTLGATLASFVNAGLLYRQLHKQGIYRFPAYLRNLIGKFILAAAVMAVGLLGVLPYFPATGGQGLRLLALLALCVLGAGIYGGVLLAMGFRPKHLRYED